MATATRSVSSPASTGSTLRVTRSWTACVIARVSLLLVRITTRSDRIAVELLGGPLDVGEDAGSAVGTAADLRIDLRAGGPHDPGPDESEQGDTQVEDRDEPLER